MKSMFKQVAAVAAGWLVLAQFAMAADAPGPGGVRALPEPGSLALVGLAIAAVIVVAKRRK